MFHSQEGREGRETRSSNIKAPPSSASQLPATMQVPSPGHCLCSRNDSRSEIFFASRREERQIDASRGSKVSLKVRDMVGERQDIRPGQRKTISQKRRREEEREEEE